MNATLSALHIFPLKSGAPLVLDAGVVEKRGLRFDRRWMVVDGDDRFVTGRQNPRLTLVRALPDGDGLRLSAPGMPDLHVEPPRAGTRVESAVWGARVTPLPAADVAHEWLSTFLGARSRLVFMDADCVRPMKAKYDGRYGTDDDEVSFADGFPLLLTATSSLDALNSLVAQGDHPEEGPLPMERFRPNVVIDGVNAYDEDRIHELATGDVTLRIVKPCTRCSITTTDQDSGAVDGTEPLATLKRYRFDRELGGVCFGQNAIVTRGIGATLRVGDEFEVTWKS